MAKSVIKELIIALLLCLAIILVLGILLYEYVPMSKTIPNPVSYTTPSEVQKELASSGSVDEDEIIMTYSVDATDLNNYKRTQDYKPGKANPFSSYEEPKTEGGNTNNSNSTTGGTTGNTNDKNTTSGGQFFQDKGTK